MTRVKICGVTSLDDARMIARAGVEMIGLNFYPPSPRSLEPAAASAIVNTLRAELGSDCPLFIGVFVDPKPEAVAQIAELVRLDAVQLSGDEKPSALHALPGKTFKALRPLTLDAALQGASDFIESAPRDERLPQLLLDAYHPKLYGGTGETANLDLFAAVQERAPRLMLAGGLTPENVAERVRVARPWGVDVASGVEDGAPGRKSPEKVLAFIQAVRSVAQQAG